MPSYIHCRQPQDVMVSKGTRMYV